MDVPFFVVIKAPHPVGCATDEEEYLLLACSLILAIYNLLPHKDTEPVKFHPYTIEIMAIVPPIIKPAQQIPPTIAIHAALHACIVDHHDA